MNVLTLSNKNKTISNEDIASESLKLVESICSDENLKFGSCEASVVKLRIRESESVIGETFNVTIQEGTKAINLGSFTVREDVPTANRCFRDITLSDSMQDIINFNVVQWYNALQFPMTLKAFRDSFFSLVGIEQVGIALANDEMMVSKTIEQEELSGKDIITAICEINGCFGHINREGKFEYVFLNSAILPSETLFPSPDLFPGASRKADAEYGCDYKSCKYEDYEVSKITGVEITLAENEHGASVGTGNSYLVEGNFLLYGKSSEELEVIASRLLSCISDANFVPCELEAVGRLDVAVGNRIDVSLVNGRKISTFVLTRTISGIQSITDEIESHSSQFQGKNLNSMQNKVAMLNGETIKNAREVQEAKFRVGELEADNVVIRGSLEAQSAKIGELEADHVSVQDLDAATARIGSLEADHVSVADLNAVNVAVSGKLDVSQLSAEITATGAVNVGSITCSTYLVTYGGRQPVLKPIQVMINGIQYVILGVEYTG